MKKKKKSKTRKRYICRVSTWRLINLHQKCSRNIEHQPCVVASFAWYLLLTSLSELCCDPFLSVFIVKCNSRWNTVNSGFRNYEYTRNASHFTDRLYKLRLFRGNLRRVCEKRHVTAVLIINTLIYSAQRGTSGRAKRRYEQRIRFSQLRSTYLFSHARGACNDAKNEIV
jgi:hypothetical protein